MENKLFGRELNLNIYLILVLVIFLAPATLRAATITVGSGKTHSTIASAISASGSGDTILIFPGTYNEYNLRPKSGTTLQGSDPDNMPVIIGYGSYTGGSNNETFRLYPNVSNITFRYLDIREGGRSCISISDSGASNITIEYNKLSITGWPSYASDNSGCIYLEPGTMNNIVIQYNEITSTISGVHGINGYKGNGSYTIKNNNITVVGDGSGGKSCCGIFWKHNGSGTTQMVVQNNYIHTTGAGSKNGGIWIVNDNVFIDNNLIFGNMRDGLDVYVTSSMGPTGGNDCIITNNTVYGAQLNGVLYASDLGAGGENNIFKNNIFYGTQSTATNPFNTFTIWRYASSSGKHGTKTDYNLYYNSTNSTPINEFYNYYSLADWKTHSGQDTHSVQEKPEFANISGKMNSKWDFEIVGGGANNGASDGKDMGVDLSSIGILGETSSVPAPEETSPVQIPQNLIVVD